MAIFGLFMTTVALIALIAISLEIRLRQQRPLIRPGHTPEGVAATVVPRAGWPVVINSVMVAAFVVAALMGAVLAFRDGNWLLGVVLAGAGLWFGGRYLVPVVLGRVSTGGVYLTVDGIEHHCHGSWWRVGWDDIFDVVPGEPIMLVLHGGATPVRGRTTGSGWKGDVPAPEGLLGVQTRYLLLDDKAFFSVLVFLLGRPDRRDELGTEGPLHAEVIHTFSSDQGS